MKAKTKRFLSKIGIGSPLNQLFYDTDEITEMRNRGEIFDPTKTSHIDGRHLRSGNKKVNDGNLYLVGYEPRLLYGKSKNGESQYVNLMSRNSAIKEAKDFPHRVNLYKIKVEKVGEINPPNQPISR